ncbi:hypothetical protein ATE71_17935 [Sphingopyxis sp. H115]|nr:hypothetical protein ATE71_17935 [Sphingopyxis sp. H115]
MRFRPDTDPREQLVNLAVQRRERLVRFDPRPHHMRPSLMVEHVDPGDPGRDTGSVKGAERGGDILGAVPIDLADEAQRQVQLVVVLPACARNTVHRGGQQGANQARRTQRDEQAVGGHGKAA